MLLLAGGDGGFDRGDGVILIGTQTGDAEFALGELAQFVDDLLEPFHQIARREPLGSARGWPLAGRASQNQMPDLVASCFT